MHSISYFSLIDGINDLEVPLTMLVSPLVWVILFWLNKIIHMALAEKHYFNRNDIDNICGNISRAINQV